jgi:hypothetical protein
MTAETIEGLKTELKASYPGALVAQNGSVTLVRLPEVIFPSSCNPRSTPAMVGLDPGKPKPDFYLKAIPSVRGAQPQYGTATVGGESWCTFSYNLKWDESSSAVQFVQGMLRRFA